MWLIKVKIAVNNFKYKSKELSKNKMEHSFINKPPSCNAGYSSVFREKRIKEGAYVWQKLIDSGARIINGTDAPVEPVDPLASFYASVSRKTLKGTPEGGYEPSQNMSRDQALKSYTINPAYGSFMEKDKSTIEVGKLADFTVFDKDIMKITEDEILETSVEMTIVGGEVKYEK